MKRTHNKKYQQAYITHNAFDYSIGSRLLIFLFLLYAYFILILKLTGIDCLYEPLALIYNFLQKKYFYAEPTPRATPDLFLCLILRNCLVTPFFIRSFFFFGKSVSNSSLLGSKNLRPLFLRFVNSIQLFAFLTSSRSQKFEISRKIHF